MDFYKVRGSYFLHVWSIVVLNKKTVFYSFSMVKFDDFLLNAYVIFANIRKYHIQRFSWRNKNWNRTRLYRFPTASYIMTYLCIFFFDLPYLSSMCPFLYLDLCFIKNFNVHHFIQFFSIIILFYSKQLNNNKCHNCAPSII